MGNNAASVLSSSAEMIEKARASPKECVLVTGGAGYIGSHTVIELLEAGFRVVVVDNFDNSNIESLERVRKITGCDEEDILVAECDLVDLRAAEKIFDEFAPFHACIHFAGLKAVGESVKLPLMYHANNLNSTINLIHLLDKHDCHAVAFSSSATVYGDPEENPIPETHPLRSTNPYGKTKLFIEEIFRDEKWSVALLRYFNPVGAHPSGLIGEDPKGIPNNLLPYISQVAVGKLKELSVFGDDWDTPDGTGVRDYIHVVDLAKGHVAAIEKVLKDSGMGAQAYNLGTGNGTSVLEMVKHMEKACGHEVPYRIAPRRAGDIGTCYGDPSKARKELGWEAKLGIEEAVADSWRWQSQNPNGFRPEGAEDTGPEPRKCVVFELYK
ncbi:UDP-glucose 4-epimerase [Hondaea fermentalgiana]|uniref:UDP-glucose 4-epimerase n=1 Tax=Hondaea fermentalgiana TaxID=2315210 RepID=A0A2R5GBZ6_9STRA|nr:UDP-glucose 4-epimerase [Hondaea fermentalgiana]|eukprot:GBG25274.1 UDP-glucose 4-epimerase [Hondaea fermentalgiana]